MSDWVYRLMDNTGLSQTASDYLATAVCVLVIALLSGAAYRLFKGVFLKLIFNIISRSSTRLDDVFQEHRVFDQLLIFVPALIIYLLSPLLKDGQNWLARLAVCMIIFGILRTADKCLGVADTLYRKTEASRTRPIKGFLQVIKIAVYVLGIIVMVGVILNRSPALLLGGVGAASAVLLLVFQNTILGFVASIQLTENKMLRIGDWIEMPAHNADGEVKEITLYTVKVENWDKTVTTIPTYSMISESFKNWRSMTEAGGRRIKRSFLIDTTSIRFCTKEMLDQYRKIQYIHRYLHEKTAEIRAYNEHNRINLSSLVNGRRLTNVGTFRAYLRAYLKHHPQIHQGMTILVRQLAPCESGLPVEIYAFTSTTDWNTYESIQADIFDHILSVAPLFDLRLYQKPTGHDLIHGIELWKHEKNS
ncbi:MscS Mechanosensitive ion channel [Syntrophobotulus glycolicus DSM 8271]|uniref:Mechanosensing system component YbdG n=1 Tax=Syntrophobotulus glycolicus (strain DSM 8271 / FlGlyR) TaxID=645991 RepID=F0SUM4_SYNGF|nr:mechanosensitive ion channel domain-containing protein [Syntrophobotulus glycolicus]ADY55517.1 MscS Mechanosensitive ion channel [Syntrophobotulus glycolicus DSM 8271]